MILGGRFELQDEVASGGMGTVYRAVDRDRGGPVAVKVLRSQDPEDVARFRREAAVLQQLRHAGIVHYVASGRTDDGAEYLVEEWIDGETLAARLDQVGLSTRESVATIRCVAEALAEAHQRGVVHRDIKPANLLYAGADPTSVKLIDFGIARRSNESRRMTATGMLIGTPAYMAPEQARGERAIDARADVFALGCVLYECLTGRAPFAGSNKRSVRAKVLLLEPPRVSTLRPQAPPALDALVAGMLAKDRAGRPDHAGQVAEALAAIGELPEDARRVAAVRDTSDRSEEPTQTLPVPPRQARACLCVLLATHVSDAGGSVAELVERHGGRCDRLADGSLVITTRDRSTPEAQANTLARVALALSSRSPDAAIAIASRAGAHDAYELLDELLDRSARQLDSDVARDGAVAVIRVDGLTAGLLGERFEIDADDEGLVLRAALA